eukprot:XP_011448108.1 PREDICTED: prostaglandin E2 receptor EP4 subtype-like [Crassostrea gigas]
MFTTHQMNQTTDSLYIHNSSTTNSGSGVEKPAANIVPSILFMTFGTLGNGLVLFLLCRFSAEHKWRPFYRFVLALSINDLLGFTFATPFGIARYITNFNFDFPDRLCSYIAFIHMFGILNSACIVLSMSLDRFIAIVFPFKYSTSLKDRRANLLLLIGCVVSFLMSTIPLLAGRRSRRFYPGSWCFVDFKSDSWVDRGISLAYASAGFIIMCLVVVLNISVIVTLVRQHCLTGNERKQQTAFRKKRKHLIVLMFAVVVLAVVCNVPLLINVFARSLGILQGMESFEVFGLRMAYVNNVLNPWVYILLRKETVVFFQKFLRLQVCCKHRETSTDSMAL